MKLSALSKISSLHSSSICARPKPMMTSAVWCFSTAPTAGHGGPTCLFMGKSTSSIKWTSNICERLLLKDYRINMPSAFQCQMLELFHDGHQGINRCKALAQESVWWPGINNQIKTLLCNCSTCTKTKVQSSEPMLPSTTSTLPREKVGIDFFFA